MTKTEVGDDDDGDRKKLAITRFQAALLVVGVVASLVLVGLLAGLLRPPCSSGASSPPGPDLPRARTYADAVAKENKTTVDEQDGRRKKPGKEEGKRKGTEEEEEEDGIWRNHRLPQNLIPDHYDLALFPDFYDGRSSFTGNVSIRINVTESPASVLLVHIKALRILRSLVRLRSSPESGVELDREQELAVKRNFSYDRKEFWVIEMQRPVAAGSVIRIEIQFEGSLDNGLTGLYRSRYVDSRTGKERFLATSKFQPTDARKAFPCLDEPTFKSTFTVTLFHRPEYIALSNMPQESVANASNGLVATRFQRSVPMVTYLACFVVCDFSYKENMTSNGVPIRIFATPDKIDQVDYALSISGRILELYENTFGLPYPLPKLDQIAIPDFASGAMEHWGLVTYRETVLLYSEREASVFNRQRVAVVVAHELAHMWFGNLVTMKWWNDLWLNEGFASYVEYMGVSHVHPDWSMDSQFLPDDMQSVMAIDATVSSHPIVVPVDHPDQINEVFDSISYSKGAAVLRMLEGFLGSEKFKKGLQLYMKTYQYKITETIDLWHSLSQADDGAPDVNAVMETWTTQMGYPLVNVTFPDDGRVHLSQERFLMGSRNLLDQPPSKFNYTWQIPLLTTSSSHNSSLIWLKKKHDSFDLPDGYTNDSSWIKFNANSMSYVRVNYPQNYWNQLAEVLRKTPNVLSASDRSNLIDDAFSLAKAGVIGYHVPLDLVRYIGREEEYAPWKTLEVHVYYIREMMQHTVHFGGWKRYMNALIGETLQKLRYDRNGTHIQRLTRSPILSMACGIGNRDCLNKVSEMFKDWIHESKYVVPSLRGVVYRYGMQSVGQQSEWEKLWEHYVNTTVPQEKTRLLMGLAQAREVWLIHRLLAYALDDRKIRTQDCFTAITYLTANPLGRSLVWDWARINWNYLVNRFTLNSRYLGRMIPGIVNNFNTPFQLEEVKRFFVLHPDAGAGERGRGLALDTISANIVWMDRNLNDIAKWLENNGYA